jgi:uncharacterized protein YdeI (YjbR/CyaY-like superfamily)
VDAYIARSAPFAQPILEYIRSVVHEACPDVEETVKWSMPHFMYHGILGGMSAFKAHCAFGFWKRGLVVPEQEKAAMGQFGRIESVKDLPPRRKFVGYVKKAMKLNEEGVAAPRATRAITKKPLPLPPELARALGRSRKARATFDGFPPSQRREYIEWITEARREETRARRVAQAVEWMAEGKVRHWKYQK